MASGREGRTNRQREARTTGVSMLDETTRGRQVHSFAEIWGHHGGSR